LQNGKKRRVIEKSNMQPDDSVPKKDYFGGCRPLTKKIEREGGGKKEGGRKP